VTRPVHPQEDPKGDQAQNKRRALADGPAVRQALAQAESDAKSNAGWKLLETPLESSHVSEISGLLKTVDDTQPEPSWKVVAVADEPMPTNPADPAPTRVTADATASLSPTNATATSPVQPPARRRTPAMGSAIGSAMSSPRAATPGVPRPASGVRAAAAPPQEAAPVDATTRARTATPTPATALAGAAPNLAATQKSVAPFANTSSIPRPTPRRQTPPALPVAQPRPMMATQMGVAPPPAQLEPVAATPPPLPARNHSPPPLPTRNNPALASTQLDASPPPLPTRDNPALASTQLLAPAPRQDAALADTQLAVPRPRELDALLDALDDDSPTVVKPAEFMLELAAATQSGASLAQAPVTTRSVDAAPLPLPTRGESASSTLVMTQPLAEPGARATPHLDAARAALPSEAFATTQDTLPPLPMSGLALQLPSPFNRWSRKKLIGVASVALVAAMLPLIAAGLLLTAPADSGAGPIAAAPAEAAPAAAVALSKAPRKATPTQATPTKATLPQAQPPPAKAPAPNEPSKPAAPSAATPAAPANTGGVPWLDRTSSSTPSCDSLTSAPVGPKGFLLQQALKQGQRELIRGNVKGAHTAFCQAVLLGQPSDVVLTGLAQVLLMQSDMDAALKAVDQLLTLKPNDRHALDLRGDILIRMGRADDALATWYRAAGASRPSASLIENLRRAYRADAASALRAGDLARADRLWRRVIALDVRDVAASAELAAVLAKNGDRTAAERWLAYAQMLDPAHPRVAAVKASLGG